MTRHEEGFSLASVLVTFVLLLVLGLGMLSLLTSGMRGAALFEQGMQALHAAEAGLNFGVAQLVSKASETFPADESYAGEPEDTSPSQMGPSARGTFRVTVFCLYPSESLPPACDDNPATAAVDERDFRRVISSSAVPGRNAPARRHLEATVRRYTLTSRNADLFGICGRSGVELLQGTSVIGDVGSNGHVLIEGPPRPLGTVRARSPRAPTAAPAVEPAETAGKPGLSGTYTWRVTFMDATGGESGGSPPTAPMLLVNQHARLTGIPLGESGVARRRIYRTAADTPSGPWFLVGEIPDNKTLDYTDSQLDKVLIRIPTFITGSVTAAGSVSCSINCGTQVEGHVRERVRDVVCPNYLPPPVLPGSDRATDPIIQKATEETIHLHSLVVPSGDGFSIQTLSTPGAQLHIHVNDVYLENGATLAVSGAATIYLHVSGTFVLEEGAVFGAIDFDGNMIGPADRIHVLITARDPSFAEGGTSSVRLAGSNKMAGVIFAPYANIDIERAAFLRGGLFGKYIRITDSTGLLLEPNEGLGSATTAIRPSPYQYLVRWYDNPNP